MKKWMCEFSVKLADDNFTSFGIFYVNAKDISDAFDKMISLRDAYLCSYDEFELINIKLV